MKDVEAVIAKHAGKRPRHLVPLSGGSIAPVYRVDFEGGERLVAKFGTEGSGLALEGRMLRYLAAKSRLPVPAVLHADDRLLLMNYVESSGAITASVEEDAAELLADLHGITAAHFGFEEATLIGGLHQPNPPTVSWREFFRDQRLCYMAGEAAQAGRLPKALLGRIDWLAARLDEWIGEEGPPSLIHGDLWGGNVLARKGRIAAFVDPAIYFADPEIELAFSTLFSTFGEAFFRRYGEIRGFREGFWEDRRALYNLYPLLVHVRLFGGGYVDSVERTLSRFGA
ncbi:MAG: fructosamine kinase family protein [Alphaproteobacteria bacterium]|nr:fructosamine kinase family protein [Alphaproteobacteria bacterium]